MYVYTKKDAALTAEAAAATTADISNALILDTKSIKDRHKSLRDTGNGVKGGVYVSIVCE